MATIFVTLEKAFSAVATATANLEADDTDHPLRSSVMDCVADRSRELYDQLTKDADHFTDYFRLATPIDVIEQMHIGLKHTGDTEQLEKNIPWALAWAQSRHLLPSWFGFGSGLETAMAEHGDARLRSIIDGIRISLPSRR